MSALEYDPHNPAVEDDLRRLYDVAGAWVRGHGTFDISDATIYGFVYDPTYPALTNGLIRSDIPPAYHATLSARRTQRLARPAAKLLGMAQDRGIEVTYNESYQLVDPDEGEDQPMTSDCMLRVPQAASSLLMARLFVIDNTETMHGWVISLLKDGDEEDCRDIAQAECSALISIMQSWSRATDNARQRKARW